MKMARMNPFPKKNMYQAMRRKKCVERERKRKNCNLLLFDALPTKLNVCLLAAATTAALQCHNAIQKKVSHILVLK